MLAGRGIAYQHLIKSFPIAEMDGKASSSRAPSPTQRVFLDDQKKGGSRIELREESTTGIVEVAMKKRSDCALFGSDLT